MQRCAWAGADAEYRRYHDEEWGRPVTDDNRLFETLCLEGFQSGLSWLTILKKRPQFRSRFKDFDIAAVAAMGDADIAPMLADAGIVRHRGKIASTLNNARRALAVQHEFGSFASYIWPFEPQRMILSAPPPSQTDASRALSRDLRRRGFTFIGPTTSYAFMQAMGLVNDHDADCFCRGPCEAERKKLKRP